MQRSRRRNGSARCSLKLLPKKSCRFRRLVFSQGRGSLAEDPSKGMTFAEAVVFAETKYGTLGSVGSYVPPRAPGRYKGAGVGPSPAYSYTACVVEVEVDQATGWVSVPKVWIAHDIGRTINPVSARGQVEGSVYMALGEALMEEQVFRRLPPKMSGALVHKFPSLLEYKSLHLAEMPEGFTERVEDPDPTPFGLRKFGGGRDAVDAAVAERDLRRGRCAHRRTADHPDKLLKALI